MREHVGVGGEGSPAEFRPYSLVTWKRCFHAGMCQKGELKKCVSVGGVVTEEVMYDIGTAEW